MLDSSKLCFDFTAKLAGAFYGGFVALTLIEAEHLLNKSPISDDLFKWKFFSFVVFCILTASHSVRKMDVPNRLRPRTPLERRHHIVVLDFLLNALFVSFFSFIFAMMKDARLIYFKETFPSPPMLLIINLLIVTLLLLFLSGLARIDRVAYNDLSGEERVVE